MDLMNEQLFGTLRPHLKFLGPDQQLDMKSNLPQLGLDSMSAINLLLDLEQTFNVVIPDELLVAETFRTPTSLTEMLETLNPEPV